MMAGHGFAGDEPMRLEPRTSAGAASGRSRHPAAVARQLRGLRRCWSLLGGASPLSVFALVIKGAAGSQFAFLETLTRATPLIFTGLAAAVAFRAKLWNIGGEAQLYIGAVMAIVLGTGAAAAAGADPHSDAHDRRRCWPARCCCSGPPSSRPASASTRW